MTPRDLQLADRLHMLRNNESAVQMMLGQLDEDADVVATIIDTRDEIGHLLAEHLRVAEEVERVAGPHRIPTILGSVARLDAARAFRETHPSVAACLSAAPPSGHVPVVVIASGGVTMVYIAREPFVVAGDA